jgi:putative ATP-binding cassette transporter
MKSAEMKPRAALWLKVYHAISHFFRLEASRKAKRLFALLLVCMLVLNGLNVLNSYVGRDFISSVESRNMPRFMWVSLIYVLVFGACTMVAVYYRFIEERLALLWRDWQTRQLVGDYLSHRAYLRIAGNGTVENPDQRIAEDARTFATTSLSLFLMLVNAGITVVAFSGVMWSISPLLFAGAVVYAALGSAVTILLGRRLVGLNSAQLDREAEFRAELIHVRENVEGMAILGREDRDKERLLGRFAKVVDNGSRVIAVNRNVSFFTTGYNYLIPVIPVFVVAHLFMWGQVEFGVVTQSAMAFAHLMGAFSLIVTQFQSMSAYAAVVARLRGLSDSLEEVGTTPNGPIQIRQENGTLRYEHVTLHARGGQVLVRDLNLTIPRTGGVLVHANDSRAPLAIFRATTGLWQHGEGTITRPEDERIMFLPERAYLPKGTLRELMDRPGDDRNISTTEIEEVLAAVGLSGIPGQCGGLDAEHAWSEALPSDEQALLAVARALLVSPEMVLWDHPGSALTPPRLKQVLDVFKGRGISCVAFGRTGGDALSYDHDLQILADGMWHWNGEAPPEAPLQGSTANS